ncbi:hypothetical protein RHMOL_Rhmol07G0196200 [Rhododendron molle]|uniref:Uncharacterized protein n=1 Tax=Rhododendron molle TaxID=49168 RepID=A0ACC0N2F9_RHOML|nr:hypothetical protein RHMOL_Rhmol07G0196200 [Rhododendron molle]
MGRHCLPTRVPSALVTLHGHLGACSRDKSPILGGHYRVLQLWAFEHLLQFPPDTKHEDVSCISHYERWLVGQRKPRSPILSLLEWRQVLDWLTIHQVRFDPWSGVPEDAHLVGSRVLDHPRSLLEGPFCRAWYLGDRVVSQWCPRAEAFQFLPPHPPTSMRSTSSLFKENLKNARIRG